MIKKIYPQKYKIFYEELDRRRRRNVYYVLSFSLSVDSLDQWVKYGNHGCGVAIGFSDNFANEIENIPHTYCFSSQVVYCSYEGFVNEEEKDSMKELFTVMEEDNFSPDDVSSVCAMLIASCKDKCFSSEQEFRLVFCAEPDHYDPDCPKEYFDEKKPWYVVGTSFRAREMELIPYIEVKFPSTVIREVILPPERYWKPSKGMLFPCLEDHVRRFLDSSGYEHVRISPSKQTYRQCK